MRHRYSGPSVPVIITEDDGGPLRHRYSGPSVPMILTDGDGVAVSLGSEQVIVVDQSGKGQYETIAEANDAISNVVAADWNTATTPTLDTGFTQPNLPSRIIIQPATRPGANGTHNFNIIGMDADGEYIDETLTWLANDTSAYKASVGLCAEIFSVAYSETGAPSHAGLTQVLTDEPHVVVIQPGTYVEQTKTKPFVTYKGVDRDRCILMWGTVTPDPDTVVSDEFVVNMCHDSTLEDLTLVSRHKWYTNASAAEESCAIITTQRDSTQTLAPSNISIRGCTLTSNRQYDQAQFGVFIQKYVNDGTPINDCEIVNCRINASENVIARFCTRLRVVGNDMTTRFWPYSSAAIDGGVVSLQGCTAAVATHDCYVADNYGTKIYGAGVIAGLITIAGWGHRIVNNKITYWVSGSGTEDRNFGGIVNSGGDLQGVRLRSTPTDGAQQAGRSPSVVAGNTLTWRYRTAGLGYVAVVSAIGAVGDNPYGNAAVRLEDNTWILEKGLGESGTVAIGNTFASTALYKIKDNTTGSYAVNAITIGPGGFGGVDDWAMSPSGMSLDYAGLTNAGQYIITQNVSIPVGGTGCNINFTAVGGVIQAGATIGSSGGSGYAVGDLILLSGGSNGVFRVATLNVTAVATVTLVSGGTGYSTGTNRATTAVYGTGIALVIPTGIIRGIVIKSTSIAGGTFSGNIMASVGTVLNTTAPLSGTASDIISASSGFLKGASILHGDNLVDYADTAYWNGKSGAPATIYLNYATNAAVSVSPITFTITAIVNLQPAGNFS